jgi:hypothetical protein
MSDPAFIFLFIILSAFAYSAFVFFGPTDRRAKGDSPSGLNSDTFGDND